MQILIISERKHGCYLFLVTYLTNKDAFFPFFFVPTGPLNCYTFRFYESNLKGKGQNNTGQRSEVGKSPHAALLSIGSATLNGT